MLILMPEWDYSSGADVGVIETTPAKVLKQVEKHAFDHVVVCLKRDRGSLMANVNDSKSIDENPRQKKTPENKPTTWVQTDAGCSTSTETMTSSQKLNKNRNRHRSQSCQNQTRDQEL